MSRVLVIIVCCCCFVIASALSGCGSSGANAPSNGPVSALNAPSLSAPSNVAVSAPNVPVTENRRKGSEFNERGNIVIADQFNNRVIEIDPPAHRIVWQFGDGSVKPGAHSVVAPNDAERVGSFTLISGTGAPTGAEPGCAGANGCPDNRVILVNPAGNIVWEDDQVNTPVCSVVLPNAHVLITDQGNQRVIEVDGRKDIVWQYGSTGVPGSGPNQLNNPNSAELLANGHILIADENNNRVIEVDKLSKSIVWQYPSTPNTTLLSGAAFASRLANGNTLITDSNNNRIIEIDSSQNVVWSYVTSSRPGSVTNPLPTRAVRLVNGDTLISDQFNDQVIEVDHQTPANIHFTQGTINVAGTGPNELNAPYDAKVIGDFTGLTPPPNGLNNAGDNFLR